MNYKKLIYDFEFAYCKALVVSPTCPSRIKEDELVLRPNIRLTSTTVFQYASTSDVGEVFEKFVTRLRLVICKLFPTVHGAYFARRNKTNSKCRLLFS